MFGIGLDKTRMVGPGEALAGRQEPAFATAPVHAVLGSRITPPFASELRSAVFALGCFWGAERSFWQLPGVHTTAAGYCGGYTPNPTYKEVCSGLTGHAEAVLVVYDPTKLSYDELLKLFWESHDPTQGMRQGADIGTQYRSAIYCSDAEQQASAERSRSTYQAELRLAGYGEITTEIRPVGPFYYAEEHHQQYLHKNPDGYCGHGGTGVGCPVGLAPAQSGEVHRSRADWRRTLSPAQYAVLRQAETEPAFSGKYVDTDDQGVYHCAACGSALFDSQSKYHSGCGWPSFTNPMASEAIELADDRSHGMLRTEVRCARCHSHLGHVFDDGPTDTGGQRWCINSIALELAKD